jgi:hypothetical protein
VVRGARRGERVVDHGAQAIGAQVLDQDVGARGGLCGAASDRDAGVAVGVGDDDHDVRAPDSGDDALAAAAAGLAVVVHEVDAERLAGAGPLSAGTAESTDDSYPDAFALGHRLLLMSLEWLDIRYIR